MEYTLDIDGWVPASDNNAKQYWTVWHRLKTADKEMVKVHAANANIPKATGKRRLEIQFYFLKRGRPYDSSNLLKSLFDALKSAELIVDDADQYLEYEVLPPIRGDRKRTVLRFVEITG